MPTRKPTSGNAQNPTKLARRVNDAEPAHSIIRKVGGVRVLSRALGISAAAVTRYQTHRTADDKRGCDGIIPEARRAAIQAFAKSIGAKRITKADFLKP